MYRFRFVLGWIESVCLRQGLVSVVTFLAFLGIRQGEWV